VILENVPAQKQDSFIYITIERDLTYREHGVLRVGPENIHRMSMNLVATNENALKVASWGTARDLALVDRVRRAYPSLKDYLAVNGLKMFDGYKTGTRKSRVPEEWY